MNQLKGIHHVTAITSSAENIYEFFTYVLGLRLVKKTINQDDIKTYHLFFADDAGNPGTDVTFFDFQNISKPSKGSDEIGSIGLRVPNDKALKYWVKRFDHHQVAQGNITTFFDKKVVSFTDFDEQEYMLYSDETDSGVAPGTPWKKGPVPGEFAITGLGPIELRIRDLNRISHSLNDIMGMRKVSSDAPYTLFEMGEGGNGASIVIKHTPKLPKAIQGYSSVHHVAFRIEDTDVMDEWIRRLNEKGARHSGRVDRFYFKSLYTRLYPGILFEFATEGPGFIDDQEDYETLGETLALPPKFRNNKKEITSLVRHIDTVRSTKTFKKEYFDE